MIIYNTTFHFHKAIEHEALEWVKNVYRDGAIKKGKAQGSLLTRILAQYDDDGISYALHLNFNTAADAQKWDNGVAASLRKIMHDRWGDKALSFQTFMEEVE